MHATTLTFARKSGWSVAPLPALDSPSTLVVVFGASTYFDTPEPIAELRAAYPSSTLIGCSTSGEIHGPTISDDTLAVAVARFDHTRLKATCTAVESPQRSFDAGATIAQDLVAKDLRAIFVLSDGLSVNGSDLIRGLDANLPSGVVVTGGLAGDADRFQRTWVLADGAPRSKRVCAVAFYGDRIHVGHGSKGGWDIFGPERVVTRSKENILYELDGRPALSIYKEYLGERAAGLPATALLFPLALRRSGAEKEVVVRTILSIDESKQSMTFAGDVPEGCCAQLMRANFERLIDGASLAAQHTKMTSEGFGHETLAIAISCVGRRLILGQRSEEEVEAAFDIFPKGTQQIGFYSYGEISPHASGHCDLHNQTMTLTSVTER